MPQAAVVASLKDQLVSARFGPDYLVVTFTLYIICCLQSKKEKSKSTFSLSFCRHYKDGQHSFRDQSFSQHGGLHVHFLCLHLQLKVDLQQTQGEAPGVPEKSHRRGGMGTRYHDPGGTPAFPLPLTWKTPTGSTAPGMPGR